MDNFFLALDSCAPFEVKLIKRPLARWIPEAIKNEIKTKYILSHEQMSIVDDAANCRRKQNTNNKKWSFARKLIKKLKILHYHEALKNSRTNRKDTWNLLKPLVSGKLKQNKCNFQNPTIRASTSNNFFATAGEKTHNDVKQRIRPMNLMCRLFMRTQVCTNSRKPAFSW